MISALTPAPRPLAVRGAGAVVDRIPPAATDRRHGGAIGGAFEAKGSVFDRRLLAVLRGAPGVVGTLDPTKGVAVQKQVWVYLTASDEAALLAQLSARFSVRPLHGRFFRGTVDDLRRDPSALETRSGRRGEHVTHLVPSDLTAALVADPVSEGPFTGWTRLDDVRSEVITLVRPDAGPQGLAPSRLVASTHAWFGGQRLRKSHAFGRLVNEALAMVEALPRTAFDWLHVAPDAVRFSQSEGALHYLFRPVALVAEASTPVHRPHQGR